MIIRSRGRSFTDGFGLGSRVMWLRLTRDTSQGHAQRLSQAEIAAAASSSIGHFGLPARNHSVQSNSIPIISIPRSMLGVGTHILKVKGRHFLGEVC